MCGRFTLTAPAEIIAEAFLLQDVPASLSPRYNVAPTQQVPVIVQEGGTRRLDLVRWGLIPSWAKDPAIGSRMINARGESLADKPSFRSALRKRRCLVLADGFFEWQKEGRKRLPVYFRLRSRRPFAFAGLWERWRSPDGEEVRSCTVITGEPNELVRTVHDRMPAMLRPEAEDAWLSPVLPVPDGVPDLLVPYPANLMEALPVSTVVNSPKNDIPECIEPLSEEHA